MLVVFAPLMITIAVLIYVFDGRGVIFAHERVGRDGRKFKCLKFRTMVRDNGEVLRRLLEECEESRKEWAHCRKLKNDPRIVPVIGSLLRKSSLDELPQILNVIRGDMSVVGPRPIVEEELENYGPWKKYYLLVRPGLTGPWQIGGRSQTSYDSRVRMDVGYVKSWSFFGDVRIVYRTAMMLLRGRFDGAY